MSNGKPFQNDIVQSESLATLLKISRNVVKNLDLQKILQETVDGASSLFNWGSAAIYLLEDAQTLRLHATFPELPADFPEQLRVAKLEDHPHLAKAIETQKPLEISDTSKATLSNAEQLAVNQRRLHTLYCVPLLIDNEAIGAFIVGATHACATVSEAEANMATTLANFAALAIRNATLYRDKQQYIVELENAIVQRDAEKNEREKLQDELIHVQKMEAIGQLAGGIAHDFNNQLSGILGYAELLRYRATDEKLTRYASRIVTLAQRSADLNKRLLAFSRKSERSMVDVEIHGVIDEVIHILSHTISKDIHISHHLNAAAPVINGDPTQIQNALLNLAVNARDAMPNGGELTFESNMFRVETSQNEVGAFLLEPGEYLRVSIADTGIGMTEETIQRIYEPFFTTKQPGHGTGMGLAAVFGTMKMHNGGIEVISTPGQGTVFHLLFPAPRQVALAIPKGEVVEAVSSPGQKVMVIDDEGPVCEVFGEYMQNAGYSPHCYIDPQQALAFFEKNHRAISLVVLDMIMPQMKGSDVFYRLKEISPDVRVILVSGFSSDNAIQRLLDDGANAFIQKPFRGAALIETVRSLMDR
ncbi:MAG: response regulator [Deltaproteobacteria bacterium]|nr:response regulator [Deltaproteobacteria bacterium]